MNAEKAFGLLFAQAWDSPSVDGLVALLHDGVVLYQPHRPPIRGKAAAIAEFEKLFRWLPAFRGDVELVRGSDGVVFIEWVMKPGHGMELRAVDRFVIRDGRGAERRVYFDQVQLILQVLRRPYLWLGYLRYRFGK